jgi:hypothetical protein
MHVVYSNYNGAAMGAFPGADDPTASSDGVGGREGVGGAGAPAVVDPPFCVRCSSFSINQPPKQPTPVHRL